MLCESMASVFCVLLSKDEVDSDCVLCVAENTEALCSFEESTF